MPLTRPPSARRPGRSRAARSAPAAPASSPPTSASPNPSRSSATSSGAFSVTPVLTVRAAIPSASGSPPTVELAVSVGANASKSCATSDAEQDADEPAGDPRDERLADDLPHDEALRPAERAQRPELPRALRDRGEREQRRHEERGDRDDDREREARACPRGSTASTSEPVTLSATSFALATWAPGRRCWISFCDRSRPTELPRRADEHDVREPGCLASFWSRASGR